MNRRELLLDTAERLFAEHGFEGTSIRMLAKESGVNVAMVSYYFGSKEKLFEALVEYRTALLQEKFSGPQESSDPWLRLEAMVLLYVDRLLAAPLFHRVLSREASLNSRPELQRAVSDILMRHVNELRKILQDGIEQGLFREVDLDLTIVLFMGTTTQLISASSSMHQRMLGKRFGDDLSGLPDLRDRLTTFLLDVLQRQLSPDL